MTSPAPSSPVARLIKLGLVICGVALAALTVGAWLSGEESDLPFEYEGFD